MDNIYNYQNKKSQLEFSVAFKLSQMYDKVGNVDKSIDILEDIVDGGVDSSDTAYFYGILFRSKKNNDVDELYQYVSFSENVERNKQSYWQNTFECLNNLNNLPKHY